VPHATLTLREALAALATPTRRARVERGLADALGVEHAVSFATARGALAASVAALASRGSVGLPAYTCVAVANAVHTGGRAPSTPMWTDEGSFRPTPGRRCRW
jgi:dTDP-4-amino-4,6-dideoxygalactose transaminase